METLKTSSTAIRAFRILEVIAGFPEGCGMVDVARALDLPKQTTHRLIRQLEVAGLVTRLPGSKKIFLGQVVRHLSIRALTHGPAYQVRHGILKALVEQIGETCNLAAMVDSEVLYLDRVETSWLLRANLGPGSRVPIHVSASGKLLLGYLPKRRREQMIASLNLRPLTPHTITDAKVLRDEVEEVRRKGFAINAQEHLMGVIALAVPVYYGDQVCAAIATQAPIGRITIDDLIGLLPAMRQAANSISETLGD
jgi:DNA-binding IclR family transcriptional regulator